jgi:SagB-type dehydrogenase family enzyme
MENEPLPAPGLQGKKSLEECIAVRRSLREFSEETLTDLEVSQLLWAAQGFTEARGLRAVPSAGALYPLEMLVARPSGLYRYDPANHEVARVIDTDVRQSICTAAFSQNAITAAPAVFVITAVDSRTRGKYGARAGRYVYMEAGHAAQNLLLQAVALDLAGVPVGAFDDRRLAAALRLPRHESPLYLIPVGHPQ